MTQALARADGGCKVMVLAATSAHSMLTAGLLSQGFVSRDATLHKQYSDPLEHAPDLTDTRSSVILTSFRKSKSIISAASL